MGTGNVVDQLREAARDSGLTRLQLAKRTGLPYSVVHGFVGGYRGLTLGSAAALCRVLGLELRPVRRRRMLKG